MSLITALFVALAVFGIYYFFVFYRGIRVASAAGAKIRIATRMK